MRRQATVERGLGQRDQPLPLDVKHRQLLGDRPQPRRDGKVATDWPCTRCTRCTRPYRWAMRSLRAAACTTLQRWESTAQQAASYGEKKHTGRSPAYRPASSPTTGSAAATAG